LLLKKQKKQKNLAVAIFKNEGLYYSSKNNIKMFIDFLIAGLTMDHHIISCTLLSLETIILNYNVESNILNDLINSCSELLDSQNKEVVTQSLNLLKILVRKLDLPLLFGISPDLVKRLSSFNTQEVRFRHRAQLKLVFTKIIRRVDPNEIMKYVPPKTKNFVNAIRKAEMQKQKKKKKK